MYGWVTLLGGDIVLQKHATALILHTRSHRKRNWCFTPKQKLKLYHSSAASLVNSCHMYRKNSGPRRDLNTGHPILTVTVTSTERLLPRPADDRQVLRGRGGEKRRSETEGGQAIDGETGTHSGASPVKAAWGCSAEEDGGVLRRELWVLKQDTFLQTLAFDVPIYLVLQTRKWVFSLRALWPSFDLGSGARIPTAGEAFETKAQTRVPSIAATYTKASTTPSE